MKERHTTPSRDIHSDKDTQTTITDNDMDSDN